MKYLRLIGLAAAGWLALVISVPAHAQSGCIKEVFHKYCLGGSIQSVLNTQAPTRTVQENAATTYTFSDAGEQTHVVVHQGRIATVWRSYRPPTQDTFNRLRSDLRGLYGEPRRVVGSGAKQGRVSDIWDQGPWRVTLMWASGRDTRLVYAHEGLQAARRNVKGYNPEGF